MLYPLSYPDPQINVLTLTSYQIIAVQSDLFNVPPCTEFFEKCNSLLGSLQLLHLVGHHQGDLRQLLDAMACKTRTASHTFMHPGIHNTKLCNTMSLTIWWNPSLKTTVTSRQLFLKDRLFLVGDFFICMEMWWEQFKNIIKKVVLQQRWSFIRISPT